MPFEVFFNNIRHLPTHVNLDKTRQNIQNIAHKTFSQCKTNWFPFLKREDFHVLKLLSKNEDIVICRPDKGKGIVLLNKTEYIQKMDQILSDTSKFTFIGPPDCRMIFKAEDKINRTLKQLKDNSTISDEVYNKLYSSGSSFSILYGLPKVHKRNVPLRPILAAYNAPNFAIAKYLVPLLNEIATNNHTLSKSSFFTQEILNQNPQSFMVSFDVESLFTNVPLSETIDIIINKLFPTQNSTFHSFNKKDFRKLLELSVNDTHFIFNGKIYKQVDGMAMGSPLGPTFANIFMCHLEETFLQDCPHAFKPLFYKRYVDDTFVLFKHQSHATMFLNFINNLHPNIKFTMEIECNRQLSFLDVLITRSDKFITEVFRKATFTGLGLNYFSYCPKTFKLNSCLTLLHRAYTICSNWAKFHEEVVFLRNYFSRTVTLHLFLITVFKNFY